MSSGGRPSLRFTAAVVVAVLAVCAFAAWLVFGVGCDRFPDFFLLKSFCGKDFWTVGGPVLVLTALLLGGSAWAQQRARR